MNSKQSYFLITSIYFHCTFRRDKNRWTKLRQIACITDSSTAYVQTGNFRYLWIKSFDSGNVSIDTSIFRYYSLVFTFFFLSLFNFIMLSLIQNVRSFWQLQLHVSIIDYRSSFECSCSIECSVAKNIMYVYM